jgi:hypothetical protein
MAPPSLGRALRAAALVALDNKAPKGGAVSMNVNTTDPRDIINCTIAFNTGDGSGSSGAGIHVDQHSNHTVWLSNSIVVFNPEPVGTGTGTDNVWTMSPALFDVTHTDLGGSVSGLNETNRINVDPIFKNNAARNLQLKNTSPCLEAGDDNVLAAAAGDVLDIDEDGAGEKLDRDIRILAGSSASDREQKTTSPVTLFGIDTAPLGKIVDMGAFEHFYLDDPGQ